MMEGLPAALLQMGTTRTGLRLAQMRQMEAQQPTTQMQPQTQIGAMSALGAGQANPHVGGAGPDVAMLGMGYRPTLSTAVGGGQAWPRTAIGGYAARPAIPPSSSHGRFAAAAGSNPLDRQRFGQQRMANTGLAPPA